MNTTATIITINHKYQIELMPSGNYYPMRKHADSEFYYFRKGANGQEFRKSERGARKFIADYMVRMNETDESIQAEYNAEVVEEVTASIETPVAPDEATSILEQAQSQDLRDYVPGDTFHIYGSTSRPMSASWARIPQAVFVNANKTINNQHVYTFIVAPYELDDKTIASYEMVKLYGPVMWKPEEYIESRLPIPMFPEIVEVIPASTDDAKQYDLFIGQAANKVNLPLDCFKKWDELEPDVQAGLRLNWQTPQAKPVPSTSIQLIIQLVSKPEMRPSNAAGTILALMPREAGATIDYDIRAGTITVTLSQKYLTDAQRDWLHMSTFAARYVDSYETKPEYASSETAYNIHKNEQAHQKELEELFVCW